MKSRILIASLLGSVGIVVAAGYGQVETDIWCITYESTYLVPVFNQGSLSSTKDSGRLPIPISPSLRPTFANNTSNPTRSALSKTFLQADSLACINITTGTDLVDSDTSLIDSQSVAAAVSTSLDVAPTEAQFGPTTENLTDEGITSLIALDSTATTDTIPTTSLAAAERSVIFQIVVPDNNKRDINRRSTRAGFVGNDNPKTCTFASTFVLSQGQVVDNGRVIFYSGESYKELAGGDLAPPGSVTETFEDAGQLVFRNTALPNGEAGFCQTSDGRVYMTFSGEPAGCMQVTLAVYDGKDTCYLSLTNRMLIGLKLRNVKMDSSWAIPSLRLPLLGSPLRQPYLKRTIPRLRPSLDMQRHPVLEPYLSRSVQKSLPTRSSQRLHSALPLQPQPFQNSIPRSLLFYLRTKVPMNLHPVDRPCSLIRKIRLRLGIFLLAQPLLLVKRRQLRMRRKGRQRLQMTFKPHLWRVLLLPIWKRQLQRLLSIPTL